MALDAILAALKALWLTADPSIQLVYTYEPWAAQSSDVRRLFVAGARIHAWTMARESTAETRLATGRENERRHTIVVRGYYALGERGATTPIFQNLLELLCAALRTSPTLGGVVEYSEPPQVTIVEPRMFCEVLCHYAEIRVEVQELISW